MKKLKIFFFLVGACVIIFISARYIDIPGVVSPIKEPWYVVFAIIAITLTPLTKAWRLKYLIFPIEKKMLSIKDLSRIEYISNFLYSVAVLKLNLPAKAILLNKKCGMKLSNGASVVSFEYALDSAIVILFGFLGAFAYFRNDPRISFASIGYFVLIAFFGTVAFFSIPTDFFGKLLNHAEHISLKTVRTIITYGIKILWTIRGTWGRLFFHREMFKVLLHTAIIWGNVILVNKFLFLSVGLNVPPTWILVAMSSGIFTGGISTIPGGLGVREATMVLVYSYLGIPNDTSITVVLMNRILSTLPIIIGYLYSVKIGYDKLMLSE